METILKGLPVALLCFPCAKGLNMEMYLLRHELKLLPVLDMQMFSLAIRGRLFFEYNYR